ATPITDYFDVNTKNQVSSTNGFKMEFRLASGFLNGSALDPATSKTHSFKGVVLQKANLGRGYFRGTNESGSILIRP
ncbi:MAG TPA: hypothetical protein VN673_19480, partial [Clostridia bacterium]|nr:hypothetical protein [Clostridia bacterium]